MPINNVTASHIVTKDELCLIEQVPSSCGIVIFGASGDLAHRKLFPSLLQLLRDKVLPEKYYVVGVARSGLSDDDFRNGIQKAVGTAFSAEILQAFLTRCFYVSGDYGTPATYTALKTKLTELDKKFDTGNQHLFYLSVPPPLYASIADQLGGAGLNRAPEGGWTRLIVEKPFGQNLASAQALNQALHKTFNENQLYRIDHYLGKENGPEYFDVPFCQRDL